MFILLGKTGDALDAVYYEAQMLDFAIRGQYPDNQPTKNLRLEGFLLHVRNLIDFLEDNKSKSKKYKDDLTCAYFKDNSGRFISGSKLPIKGDLKNKINKHLQHLTLARINEKPAWGLDLIRKTVNKGLKEFIDKIDNAYFPTKNGIRKADFDLLFFEWRQDR